MDNEIKPKRPWYKRLRYIVPLGVVAVLIVAANIHTAPSQPIAPVLPQVQSASEAGKTLGSNALKLQEKQQAQPIVEAAQTNTPTVAPTPTPTEKKITPNTTGSGYINVNGNYVPSPTHASSAPAGATAQCGDGTYSFSQNHRGTCSHHGGVAEWLD